MVDGDLQRGAEELRDTAAKLRSLARQTRSPDAHRGLIDLAERFERMAGSIGDDRPTPSPR